MFCYTYLSNVECGLRELSMWSHISSEHPIFLQNVAQCLNIQLPQAIVADLNRLSQCFNTLYQEACRLLDTANYHRNNYIYSYPLAQETARLMQQFLIYDQEFLAILEQLANIAPNQPVWQTLVHHIQSEQTYMYRLIATLLQQLTQMPPQQPGMYSVET